MKSVTTRFLQYQKNITTARLIHTLLGSLKSIQASKVLKIFPQPQLRPHIKVANDVLENFTVLNAPGDGILLIVGRIWDKFVIVAIRSSTLTDNGL